GVHDEGAGDPIGGRYVDRGAVQLGPGAAGRLVALAERGCVRHAHDRLVRHRERDQRGPDLYAVGEVLRAVDRIDDPASLALALEPVLLAEDGIAGVSLADPLPDH